MDQIGWIRRLHRREKKSEREIARITGLSRNTVSKWLHGELVEPKYRRAGRPSKLTPYVDALQQALAADAKRPPGTSGAPPRRCTRNSRRRATKAATPA